ncbi:MAG: histidine phosphotransferase family protein [Pseudomonadota bacterium]
MTEPDLASAISSRICHDLVSPVGAIVNGVDLIREIGMGDFQDELGMISQSATRASSLLQFYRIAFGTAEDNDAEIARPVLQNQAQSLIDTGRISLEWPDASGPALKRAEARLLFQMLMCCRASLGMRGFVSVDLAPTGSFPVSVTAEAVGLGENPAELNPDIARLLETEPDAATLPPRLIEFALIRASAARLNVVLTTERHGASLSVIATG